VVLRWFEGGREVAALCEERRALCEEGGGFCEECGGSLQAVPRFSARSAAVLCEERGGSLRGELWFSERSTVILCEERGGAPVLCKNRRRSGRSRHRGCTGSTRVIERKTKLHCGWLRALNL